MVIKYLRSTSLLVLLTLTVASQIAAASKMFPSYPCIQPNVDFWIAIYTRYDLDQGVIHDRWDLDIVYDVIPLIHPNQHGASKINHKRIKAAKAKYRKILADLANGHKPSSEDAKRVAALFNGKGGKTSFSRARHQIRCQIGQRERYRQGLIRSGAYTDEIRRILAAHGVPEDLAYLPHVESSFNPKAYSKFGAAGIWQFTRATGRRFMNVDYTLDERRDPYISTVAAARYLKENHERLGSWPLAITAYNHGAYGVQRAVAQKGSYEGIFKEYTGSRFGFASRNFYSEFLAARQIDKNYETYFGKLKLDSPAQIVEIKLPGFAPVDKLARHFELDLETIRELNPALRPPIYQGQKHVPKGYALKIPARGEATAKTLLAKMPADMFESAQKRSRFYTVQKGDTAGQIARMHRVSLKDLILANNLGRRAVIYPGQNLQLPYESKTLLAQNTVSAPKAPVAVKQGAKKGSMAASKATDAPKVAMASADIPEKEAGAVPAVASAIEPPEGLDEVPADAVIVNPQVVIGDLQVHDTKTLKGRTIGIIRVQVEETLGHYAEWLNVPTQSIRNLNGYPFHRSIHIDEALKIPLHRVSKDEFEEKRFEFHKEIHEDFFAAYRVESLQKYEIKNGDTLWLLCHEEFEIPFWLISTYNRSVNFNALKPLQTIWVPTVEKLG